MEKRALTRYVVSLDAECSAPGMENCKVEIRDFCLSGVFAACYPFYGEKPVHAFQFINGNLINIRVSVPALPEAKTVLFQGRVVRAEESGAGIAFVNPDLNALHLLHDFARKYQPAQPLQPGVQSSKNKVSAGSSKKKAHVLLLACTQIAEKSAPSIINSFFEKITGRLVSVAGDSRDNTDKNAYLNALSSFRMQENTFKHQFAEEIKSQLQPFSDDSNKPSTQPEQSFSKLTLSLVEDDEFEEWLVYSEIERKLEDEFKDKLNDLNQCVAMMLNESIAKENNPFAPASFCKSFQEALKALTLDPKAIQICPAIIKDVLSASLGEMYDNINNYLDENGVTPVYKIKKASKDFTISQPIPEAQKASEARQIPEEIKAPGEIFPSQVTPAHLKQNHIDEVIPATDRRQVANILPNMPAPQDWYGLVQYLSALQQNATQQGTHQPEEIAQPPIGDGETATQPVSKQQFYSPEELLAALSRVHFAANLQPVASSSPQNVKTQVMTVLSHEKTANKQKRLPEREGRILDVAGSLFDSVLEDKLVANSVRPWLQQLSIPIVKMALQDDSVFSDKSHLARQVINSLAQLELYGEESADMGHNAIRKKIDQLISEVTSADEVTPQLFEKMLKDLKLIIRLQDRAYKENLEEVYAACEEEQRATRLTNIATTGSAESKLADLSSNTDGLSDWIKQTRRLHVGDWILFDKETNPQRRRLAWIARHFDSFVFVNVKGLKELTLSQTELAQQFRDGTSVVLDDGDEPLIDRAQSAMLQKMHRQLLHESTHDKLTGLINRPEFERFLAKALISSHQLNQHHAICFINLDQFSVVNNTFGYSGGDRLLLDMTKLLQDELGDRGLIARIGGDEFGMLFENCTVDEALEIVTRQKTAIQNYRFISDQKSLAITFSAGLVAIEPESDGIATLLQAAEASCRSARNKGSNYIQVYNPNDEEMSRHNQTIKWVAKIDEALDNNSLVLRHQPIAHISSANREIHHSEILLSVPDEAGNLLSPTDFIFAAESFRRMVSVDRWVIQNVFRWMSANQQELKRMGGLAINLSGATLNEEGFADFITQQAKALNIPMDKVCFEVTETAGIANLSNASEFIHEMKKTGCTFALDDFGSGLSSYAYLKNLPVDFLKIDGVFVKNMDSNPYDYAVVKSITEIGHFMGKKVIAEFVENESILDMLREIGVDYAQGYAIGKPLALNSLAA